MYRNPTKRNLTAIYDKLVKVINGSWVYPLFPNTVYNNYIFILVHILGDFNAVTGSDRHGFESVIGNYGSGRTNDNPTRLLSLCAAHSLSVLGSWFKRKDIYRHSKICNDGQTMKELDHILTNDRSFFKSIRVFRGCRTSSKLRSSASSGYSGSSAL